MFDGVKAEITILDDKVQTIKVASSASLRRCWFGILSFINEQRWRPMDHYIRKTSPVMIPIVNRLKWVEGRIECYKIIFEDMSWDVRTTDLEIKAEITDFGQIRLIQNESGSSRRYTILSFRVSRNDIGFNREITCNEINDDLSRAWMSNSVCPVDTLLESLENADVERWSATMIRERYMGIHGKIISTQRIDTEPSSVAFLDEPEDFSTTVGELDDFFMDESLSSSSGDSMVVMDQDLFSEIQRDDLAIEYRNSPGFTTRFFDDFIEACNSMNHYHFKRFLESPSCKVLELYKYLEYSEQMMVGICRG